MEVKGNGMILLEHDDSTRKAIGALLRAWRPDARLERAELQISATEIAPKDGFRCYEQGQEVRIILHCRKMQPWDVEGKELSHNEKE